MALTKNSLKLRFGVFQADLSTGELRKRGRKVPLQDQPFQVLAQLLQRAGEVVPRDDLRNGLWAAATAGDFDQGLNTAIKKIRQALGDSAENPRFIETLPRKGYRFIAPVALDDPVETHTPRERGPRRRTAVAVGSFTLLVCAAGLFLARKPAQFPPISPMPLTSYHGQEIQPTFSPDGNQVAFAWDGETQDNFDIYVKQIGAERPLRLTTDPAKDFGPAWSPDGRSVAFGRRLGQIKAGIFVISAIGGAERKIAETLAPHIRRPDPFLAWSPDGKWLVVSEADDTQQLLLKLSFPLTEGPPSSLFLISLETGERRRLTQGPPGSLFDAAPAFSPDGKTLAFVRASSWSVADVFLLRVATDWRPAGEPRRVTSWNQATNSPAWTPDGDEIIVAAGRWDASSLWRVPISGMHPPRRLEFTGNTDFPATSRQRRLAYAQHSVDINIWRAGPHSAGAQPMPSKRFIASTRNDTFPQFSPDGTRILYLSDRTGRTEIWVCNADGSNPWQVTSMNAPIVGAPRWSPDGQRIVFDSNLGGRWEVYVINATGGTPKRITDHPSDDCCASWSHDGRWIYFMSNRDGGRPQVWKMPSTGGDAIQITRGGGHAALESPDGRYLYYAVRGGEGERDGMSGLRRVPVNGGDEMDMLRSVTFYNFAVAPEGIYFIPRADADGRSAIHLFDFATGKSRPVVAVGRTSTGLSVSADGRTFLYCQEDERRSDLMLVDNFR